MSKEIYIPVWFYLNQPKPKQRQSAALIYIPVWFYLNHCISGNKHTRKQIYIPIWFYLNACPKQFLQRLLIIYIPVWFYLNIVIVGMVDKGLQDLHSSMVLSQQDRHGYIERKYANLHSSMVLSQPILSNFKILVFKFIYIPVWFYLNLAAGDGNWRPDPFTFQYGSISTKHLDRKNACKNPIYIPVWFYLNELSFIHRYHRIAFTFQYGSISTLPSCLFCQPFLHLHSSMVLSQLNYKS